MLATIEIDDADGHRERVKTHFQYVGGPMTWLAMKRYSIYQRAHEPQRIEIAGEFLAPCMPL
jgi:hypothetical protein